MKNIIVLVGLLSFGESYTKNWEITDYVILRNSNVIAKKTADDINAQLQAIQENHPGIYDTLCVMVVVGNTSVYCGENADILEQRGLIDAAHRLKDDVDTVLDARIMDQNSANPSPYFMNSSHGFVGEFD